MKESSGSESLILPMDAETIFQQIHLMLRRFSPDKATALEETVREGKRDPFRVLIATILSHRTRDENTTRAVDQLFSVYDDVEALAEGDLDEIQRLIKPAGFYHVKARRIKEVSRIILNQFKGRVPDDLDDLLSLPSVGRKTANCVLVYGYGKPAIPVDTHVHRISNRLGWVNTKKPEETERELTEKLDRRYWLEINELFIRFGQTICRPVLPHCTICSLKEVCSYYQAVTAGSTKARYV